MYKVILSFSIAFLANVICSAQRTSNVYLSIDSNRVDYPLSNIDLFNGLVEEFECTPEFADIYKHIQIQFGAPDKKGYYRACFIFYNDNTWTKFKALLNQENVTSFEDAVSIFRKSLEGVEVKNELFHIRFKDRFPDQLLKKSIFSEIQFSNVSSEFNVDYNYLPIMTLAQDKADDKLRQTIVDGKYRQAILNPQLARDILRYDINDEMAKLTLQMLRTDEIVANDNLYLPSNNELGVSGFDGSSSNVARSYFCLHSLSVKPYVWTHYYMSLHGNHPIMFAFESLIYVVICNFGLAGFVIWAIMILRYLRNNRCMQVREVVIFDCLIIYYVSYACITGEYGYMKYFLIFYLTMLGQSFFNDCEQQKLRQV